MKFMSIKDLLKYFFNRDNTKKSHYALLLCIDLANNMTAMDLKEMSEYFEKLSKQMEKEQ